MFKLKAELTFYEINWKGVYIMVAKENGLTINPLVYTNPYLAYYFFNGLLILNTF